MERGEDLGQCADGVGDGTAETARVQVERRTLNVYLDAGETTEPCAERGQVRRNNRRVRHHEDVGTEPLLLAHHDLLEVYGPGLFLTFHDELEVQRAPPFTASTELHRLQVHPDLALVVDGTPGVEVAVADLRLERRRAPLVERIDRLDVVMAVDERSRQRGIDEALRVDGRVSRGLDDLGMGGIPPCEPRPRSARRCAGRPPRARDRPRCLESGAPR